MDQCNVQPGDNVLIWGAAGGLGVFAVQLCKAAGANAVGVVSSDDKGELVKQLGAVDFINRNEFAGMMRTGNETPEEEKARFGESRKFAKRVKEILGDAPDIVFEHVGKATFPTSVFVVKPFGKVVICGATSGFNLDFDVRYLWMRQKQIIGSHFANAYECMRANQLMARGQDPPGALADDGLRGRAGCPPAAAREQAPGQDRDPGRRHLGGRGQGRGGSGRDPGGGGRMIGEPGDLVVEVKWVINPFRGDKFEELWRPVAEAALDFGATSQLFIRSQTDPALFTQYGVWPDKVSFERYWISEEVSEIRAQINGWYVLPILPEWHQIVSSGSTVSEPA